MQPSYLMTYAEVAFIKAEAAERGMGGLTPAQAAGFYIRRHHGVDGPVGRSPTRRRSRRTSRSRTSRTSAARRG